jgi:hypothetical protein
MGRNDPLGSADSHLRRSIFMDDDDEDIENLFVDLANRGLLRDTGKRRNGEIQWELTDLGVALVLGKARSRRLQ